MDWPPRPPRTVSLPLSAALAVVWVALRAVVFGDFLFPLTYVLPLLVCVWSRDRAVLWGMAAFFLIAHSATQGRTLGAAASTSLVAWATYAATVTNILVAALVIQAILGLRDRLEGALVETRAQADELRAQREELAVQGEELASQNEELAQQNEELTSQSEELTSQNEELASRRHEIEALNEELGRRGAVLQTLIEAGRAGAGQDDALQRICEATLPLLGEPVAAAAIFDLREGQLAVRARAGLDIPIGPVAPARARQTFAMLAMEQKRTAALDDTALRPDLRVFGDDGTSQVKAVLCAPLLMDGTVLGAISVYSRRPHQWTSEQFRLADWLAGQAARLMQTIRLHEELARQGEVLRDADRRKDEFLATLSHELRNPLAPIRFALELLEHPAAANHIDPRLVIERQVRHMVHLVDDLLDLTRIRSNKIELRRTRVDAVALVQEAVASCQPEFDRAQLHVELSCPDEPVWLSADADRLTQVLTNLLNNALRYTLPGGRVQVRISPPEAQVEMAVRDTGIGLDPGDLGRVFDMFTQVGGPGAGGLGIGLSLVKGLVELHGGTVEARSEGVGHGSEFIVRLPIAPVVEAQADAAPRMARVAAGTRRVLVVDDNADSAEMMACLLSLHGHEVRVATDGHAAVAAAAEFVPHVALLDIGLPGLNGYEVAERLRANPRTSGTHLIAVTGWGQDADRARATASGFDAHLTKPADPERVIRLIAETERASDDVLPA